MRGILGQRNTVLGQFHQHLQDLCSQKASDHIGTHSCYTLVWTMCPDPYSPIPPSTSPPSPRSLAVKLSLTLSRPLSLSLACPLCVGSFFSTIRTKCLTTLQKPPKPGGYRHPVSPTHSGHACLGFEALLPRGSSRAQALGLSELRV